jgi:hypothetical protein
MGEHSDTTTASGFPARPVGDDLRSRLVQPAPGPESPETRDRAGAQKGMLIILLGAGLFWLGVAAAVIFLLR